ncbi:MAG: hypothetical protein ACHRXM_17285 [Isosphaerales bacterium]
MGEVWVAKQSEPVKRKVALKLIKAGMDSRIDCHRPLDAAPGCDDSVQEALPSLTQVIGRRWIRTSDFHRVRMLAQSENHIPQALSISMVRTVSTVFKASVR